MKMKNWIWAGCMALLLGSLAFVACENKSNGGGGGGGSSNGSSAAGSIVGTWKSVVGTTAYYDESYTVIFNADKTGSLQYTEDEPDEVEGFNFTYTFDASTNIGLMIPNGASKEEGHNFKVVWITKNKIELYINYESSSSSGSDYNDEGEGTANWDKIAVFERQGSSSGSGDGDEGTPGEGGGDSGSGGQTYSLIGTWRLALSEGVYLDLTFNSDGSCVYKYGPLSQPSILNGTYVYNSSTRKGHMTFTDPDNPQKTETLYFKLEWLSTTSVKVYMVEGQEEGDYDEEELLGIFNRI